jgi:hypothetical protein
MRIVPFYLLILWAAVLLSKSMVAAENELAELDDYEHGLSKCEKAKRKVYSYKNNIKIYRKKKKKIRTLQKIR